MQQRGTLTGQMAEGGWWVQPANFVSSSTKMPKGATPAFFSHPSLRAFARSDPLVLGPVLFLTPSGGTSTTPLFLGWGRQQKDKQVVLSLE